MSSTTPQFTTLEGFAQGSPSNQKRYQDLVDRFIQKYGKAPTHLARAPGRVNLIGEHIDYCGYGVLPMALEQDIVMAFAPNQSGYIQLSNMDEQYRSITIDAANFSIDGVSWQNYFLCGFKGVIEEFNISKPSGIDILTDGSIPPSSGLSSSSALVCCSSLVNILSNGINLPSKKDVASLCARSERFIGTQGGGMDQAISFLGETGKAMMIDFNPLRCSEVHLPSGHSFVIANCGVSMNKAATFIFNERVVECRLSAKLIAKLKKLDWRSVRKLYQVQELLGVELKDMIGIVKECLHEQFYTGEEICQLLEIPVGKLVDETIADMSPQAKEAAQNLKHFKLYQGASHVYSEAHRVIEFKSVSCTQSDVGSDLGKLMTDSHVSCRDMYECSCQKLDELVEICLEEGALGSRLTGAGWGGCCVSLVSEDKISSFLDRVATKFYNKTKEELETSLFATKPGPGAALCTL